MSITQPPWGYNTEQTARGTMLDEILTMVSENLGFW